MSSSNVTQNSNFVDSFVKNYGALIQSHLEKIEPTSMKEVEVAIEALRSITEAENNHEVDETLKDRIDNIKYLLSNDAAEMYVLGENRPFFKEILLERTTIKINHLVNLTKNKNEADQYFVSNEIQRTKTQNTKAVLEEKKAEEIKNPNTTKHVMADDDWKLWYYITTKPEYNEWSLANRDLGFKLQSLETIWLQNLLNINVVNLPIGKFCISFFLTEEQLKSLNEDQVYVLGSRKLFDKFIILLSIFPFDEVQKLEKEHFHMMVDNVDLLRTYAKYPVNCKEFASLSITKLYICLNPLTLAHIKVKRFLSLGLTLSELSQFSNPQFQLILLQAENVVPLLKNILQSSDSKKTLTLSVLKNLFEYAKEIDCIIRNGGNLEEILKMNFLRVLVMANLVQDKRISFNELQMFDTKKLQMDGFVDHILKLVKNGFLIDELSKLSDEVLEKLFQSSDIKSAL